jgi:hypothetical protein
VTGPTVTGRAATGWAVAVPDPASRHDRHIRTAVAPEPPRLCSASPGPPARGAGSFAEDAGSVGPVAGKLTIGQQHRSAGGAAGGWSARTLPLTQFPHIEPRAWDTALPIERPPAPSSACDPNRSVALNRSVAVGGRSPATSLLEVPEGAVAGCERGQARSRRWEHAVAMHGQSSIPDQVNASLIGASFRAAGRFRLTVGPGGVAIKPMVILHRAFGGSVIRRDELGVRGVKLGNPRSQPIDKQGK